MVPITDTTEHKEWSPIATKAEREEFLALLASLLGSFYLKRRNQNKTFREWTNLRTLHGLIRCTKRALRVQVELLYGVRPFDFVGEFNDYMSTNGVDCAIHYAPFSKTFWSLTSNYRVAS